MPASSLFKFWSTRFPAMGADEILGFCNEWKFTKHLKRNDYLVKKGQNMPYLFFIEKGAVRIIHRAESEELTIRFGYEEDIIAVFPSFFNAASSHYDIQALKSSCIVGAPRSVFENFLQRNPKMYELWSKNLEQLLLEQLEREIDILTTSPSERYQRVLKRSPKLFQEVPLKYIASYLRMSPETLSRLRKS